MTQELAQTNQHTDKVKFFSYEKASIFAKIQAKQAEVNRLTNEIDRLWKRHEQLERSDDELTTKPCAV